MIWLTNSGCMTLFSHRVGAAVAAPVTGSLADPDRTEQRADYPFRSTIPVGYEYPRQSGPWGRIGALNQASAEGQASQVGSAPGAGLVANPVQVGADGADADEQFGGDLGVGVA